MRPEMRDFIIRETGCIVCLHRGLGFMPAEKHHLLTTGRHGTGKRRGEKFTVGLCQFHHRGVGPSSPEMGPSYANNARAFRELYSDEWLLAQQEMRINRYMGNTIGGKA